jgi:hypothetical protein
MAVLGLRDAARQVGVHRSSIHRAIKAGRLSATRTETGDYAIDPAELFRAYPPRSDVARQGETVRAEQSAPTSETAGETGLCIRVATLQAENEMLRAMAERERRLLEDALREARMDRDAWKGQAERLTLAAPVTSRPRRWWPWRRTT